jgi:hypothetical protein
MASLYALADEEIRLCITDYLSLMEETNALANLQVVNINTDRKRLIILAGLNVQNVEHTAEEAFDEWSRAIAFDLCAC